jgi:murein DD-endopeptidase
MQQGLVLSAAAGAVLLGALTITTRAQAPESSAVPVDLAIPIGPTPVRADGRSHLVYELHITNFSHDPVRLMQLDVLGDDPAGHPLRSHRGPDLADRIARPGLGPDPPSSRVLGGGLRAVVFLDLAFDRKEAVPVALNHRLTTDATIPGEGRREGVVVGARVLIQPGEPLVIDPPLRGDSWVAANGLSNKSPHRRALYAVDGKARIAQRFAIDWLKLGPDGRAFRGDPKRNASWYGYGAEALAIADATVVSVKDGLKENVPTASERAVPMTLETICGNHVLLDLGAGRFALYGHLQPGSIRVRVGDRVRRQQVLGLVGNSGNSDAPHLHIHIADAPSALGAEGLPFVFGSYMHRGRVESIDQLFAGQGWSSPPGSGEADCRREMPLEDDVVRFP